MEDSSGNVINDSPQSPQRKRSRRKRRQTAVEDPTSAAPSLSPIVSIEVSGLSQKEEMEEEEEVVEDDDLQRFLRGGSTVYCELLEDKKKWRGKPEMAQFFTGDTGGGPGGAKRNDKKVFQDMVKVMEEIDRKGNLQATKARNFLDVCCGPGGATHYLLSRSRASKGTGYALPSNCGGSSLLISSREKRFHTTYFDVSQTVPQEKASFDLVLLNGWKEGEGNALKGKILITSQLLIAFTHLLHGGKLVVLLDKKEEIFYASIVCLLLQNFDQVLLLKPKSGLAYRSSFYAVCHTFKSKEMVAPLKRMLQDLKGGKDVHSLVSNCDIVKRYGKQLLELYSPLWEAQQKAMDYTFSKVQLVNYGAAFRYEHDTDTNGILYHLTKGDCKSETSPVTVTATSMSVGEPIDFISREKLRCWTESKPYSGFMVDLGKDNIVRPEYYTLGYASSGNACYPLYWVFQAAKEMSPEAEEKYVNAPHRNPMWRTLAMHNHDESLNSEWSSHTWKVNTTEAFRYFRIIQTAPNSFKGSGEESWSQVLVANRFELYGQLYGIPFPVLESKTTPMQYGRSGLAAIRDRPTELIRAEPHITREIVDVLTFFSRHNDQKPEKVHVHDIHLSLDF